MDRVGIDFRYANKFAQSQPQTPQRHALGDVVRVLSKYDLDTAREVIFAQRENVVQHTPDSQYCSAVTSVYDEFLQFTQEGGQ